MPSNECTTTLMELGFAVGNMVGAEDCGLDDWNQIQAILDRGWECSTRGDIDDAKENLGLTVVNAKRACADGSCPPSYCVDLFNDYWKLAQTMGVYNPQLVGRAKRSAVPRLVKGPEGVQKSQTGDQQHAAEMRVVRERERDKVEMTQSKKVERQLEAARERQRAKDEADRIAALEAKQEQEQVGARYTDERRRRWYPEKSMG